jgi:hypothetical protein
LRNLTIARERLLNQRITGAGLRRPEEVVSWLGAVQAQEYPAARWGLVQRLRAGAADRDIALAVDEGRILRTHVMRPTWHFVLPADIRWMLELTAHRVHRTMASYCRRNELDAATLTRAAAACERVLEGGRSLTRGNLGTELGRRGIIAKGMRLALLTMYAELEGVICSGPYQGKQLTYALVAERAPRARPLARDEALAELTRRYFTSHGPATIRDFVWWSGLTTAAAKRGLEIIGAQSRTVGDLSYWTHGEPPASRRDQPLVHLLPVYDEYLVSYRDRAAVPHPSVEIRSRAGGIVTFLHALIVAGQVAGTWKVARTAGGAAVSVIALRRLTRSERDAVIEAAADYGRFIEAPVTVSFS